MAACSSPQERLEKFSESGHEFLENGEFGKANVQFQNALKIDDTHVPTLVGLSKIAEERQDFRAMFVALQRVVRADPEHIEANVQLGKLRLIGEDESVALEHAETVLAVEPQNIGALSLKAAILLKAGDRQGAVALAEQALALDPANTEAITVLATERTMAEAPLEAIAIIDRALEADQQVAILHLLRIQILTTMDRQEDVERAFTQLIDLYPNDVSYRRIYAASLVNSGRLALAAEQIQKIAELEPGNLDAKLDVVRLVKETDGDGAAIARLKAFVDEDPSNADLQFALGDFYRQVGETAKAMALYEEVSERGKSEEKARALNHIAALYLASGENQKARTLVAEILQMAPDDAEALIKQAGFSIEDGDIEAAILGLRQAQAKEPENLTAMVLMASAFEQKGDMTLARSEYAKANDVSQNAPEIAQAYAEFLTRQRDLDRAESVLVEALALAPGELDNLKLLGALRVAKQDWAGAQEVADIIESLGDQDDVAANIRTIAYNGLEDYERVISELQEKSEKAPLEARPLATLISAFLKSGRTEEAEETLRRIIRDNPAAYIERIFLANVLSIQGRADESEKTLLEAIDLQPEAAVAYEMLYRDYFRKGRVADAEALIDAGLARTPDNYALRMFKADLFLGQQRFKDAFDVYAALVDERSQDQIVVNNYISLASDLLDDQDAIRRALERGSVLMNGKNPYFSDTLGWAYYKAGQPQDALPFLQEAIRGDQQHPEFLFHLGATHIALGNVDEGRKSLEDALELGGDAFRYKSEAKDLLEGS